MLVTGQLKCGMAIQGWYEYTRPQSILPLLFNGISMRRVLTKMLVGVSINVVGQSRVGMSRLNASRGNNFGSILISNTQKDRKSQLRDLEELIRKSRVDVGRIVKVLVNEMIFLSQKSKIAGVLAIFGAESESVIGFSLTCIVLE